MSTIVCLESLVSDWREPKTKLLVCLQLVFDRQEHLIFQVFSLNTPLQFLTFFFYFNINTTRTSPFRKVLIFNRSTLHHTLGSIYFKWIFTTITKWRIIRSRCISGCYFINIWFRKIMNFINLILWGICFLYNLLLI